MSQTCITIGNAPVELCGDEDTPREGIDKLRSDLLSTSIEIREATSADIPALAALHIDCLPGDFLARLGRTFLTRVLFPTLLESPRSQVYIADHGGRIAGMIVTRIGLSGVIGETLSHHPFWFLVACAKGLIRRPVLLRDCLSVLTQLCSKAIRLDDRTVADVFLLAVDRRVRQQGVGTMLVRHSADRLRTSGLDTYRVFLHADNEPADRFYAANGFTVGEEHNFAGRAWRQREMKLAPVRQI